MTVTVSFFKAGTNGITPGVAVGPIRVMEEVAVGASTTAAAEAGEFVMVGNHESSMIRIAKGTTPDADAAASTSATSAGFPVSAGGVSEPIIMAAGDKINVELAD